MHRINLRLILHAKTSISRRDFDFNNKITEQEPTSLKIVKMKLTSTLTRIDYMV